MLDLKKKFLLLAAGALAITSLCGCSRSVLNYQVAECIGTLGQFDNNEPVETPKMKAEREVRESEEAKEQLCTEALDTAEQMALRYQYEEAISYLENTEELNGDERAESAIKKYQTALDSMYEYDGVVPHFCFTNVVVDTDRAFDGDEFSSIYKSNMITLQEFENILNALYADGYMLIDLHSLTNEASDSDKNVSMSEVHPMLPSGKKPFIFSVENLNFESMRSSDGVATALALDGNGEVAAVYVDDQGHQLLGPYDVVTALEAFIDEHPDFSYKGAKGIIGLSGNNGILGYDINPDVAINYDENIKNIKEVAAKLISDGWRFASEGFSYQYMGDMSYETLREDIIGWQNQVASLVGPSDILMYPYGSEVDYSTEKAALIQNQGFHYLIGMWSDGDHLEINDKYLRQTRRTVTGYVLMNYPGNFSNYFSVTAILDKER